MRKIIMLLGVISMYANQDTKDIEWLKKNSILYQASILENQYSGNKIQWQHQYGFPESEKICSLAPNWITSYSFSTITAPDKSVIETIGSEKLWNILEDIGITAIHTGPMEIAGGIIKHRYTPSVDGGFDPISLSLDPQFGTLDQYHNFINVVKNHNSIIIGDLIPGHTGRGFDFLLAIKKYKDYSGLYHMVEIDEKDWNLLPDPKKDELTVNLPPSTVDQLRKQGYIVGELQSLIFYDPESKISNWSATEKIKGVDGKTRRWVYLHYFKDGQPTLNWLDPSFAANRLTAADIINSIFNMKNTVLRIDANPFLGIEKIPGSKKAWSQDHPLAFSVTNQLAMMTRKFGGYTFQELNMSIPDIKLFSMIGPDLSYDFITRSAYVNATLEKDTEFLRIMTNLMYKNNVSPIGLIHALQNHDEINYELVHLTSNSEESYYYHNHFISGEALKKTIIKDDYSILFGEIGAGYNVKSGNGPCTTMVGICASALGIKDIFSMTDTEKEKVKKLHLLLAFYNAMQPGVFALSGWDIVGAYPLQRDKVKSLTKDGDNRWINRGAYDLMGENLKADQSFYKIPKAEELYGPLPKQIKDPKSFANQLKKILKARKAYNVHLGNFVKMPFVKNKSVFAIIYSLPNADNLLLVAINFGDKKINEKITFNPFANSNAINIIEGKSEEKDFSSSQFILDLEPYDRKAILFRPRPTAQK